MPIEIIRYDNLVMVAASLLLLVFARSGFRISRLEGAVLLTCYIGYVFTLWPK